MGNGDSTLEILDLMRNGGDGSIDRLYKLLYTDLKNLAKMHIRSRGGTFTPTVLVNELYIKLSGVGDIRAEDRRHLMSLFSRAMRQILIDHARSKLAQKRGGLMKREEFDLNAIAYKDGFVDLLSMNQALQLLEQVDKGLANIVEWRFFGGYTNREIGESTGVTERTIERNWQKAKSFLLAQLHS